MIKVNLLNSVTDKARGPVAVEQKVTSPSARVWMLGASVFALMALVMIFDYVSAGTARDAAQAELERQQQIAAQMASINKEQAELEKKIKDIQYRIDAIKKLRASQQGPVALLSEINGRIPAEPNFRLESIEQKGGELTIEGHSPNEYAVTQFGRGLEFSSGVFANVSMEMERKPVEFNPADYDPSEGPFDLSVKPETVKFKIKCRYTPASPAPGQPAPGAPANQVASK
ncbi:MAG TPA: PilN domain-containing protein [Pyrinomonadaceae bacterium]|nr:PilN domain-containing protein [Pyrinomonadaceae bacterium]